MIAARPGNLYVAQESGPRDISLKMRGLRPMPGGALESGLVKIGFSRGPAEDRLTSVSRQVGRSLNVLAIFRSNHREEMRVLRRFRHLVAQSPWGSEWHLPSVELQEFVSRVSVDECAHSWGCLGMRIRVSPSMRIAA